MTNNYEIELEGEADKLLAGEEEEEVGWDEYRFLARETR